MDRDKSDVLGVVELGAVAPQRTANSAARQSTTITTDAAAAAASSSNPKLLDLNPSQFPPSEALSVAGTASLGWSALSEG